MPERDPYKVLGVSAGASPGEIKRAYHQAARATHPDLNPGDPKAEERFKEVQAAYALLSDTERRREWEQGRLSFREVLERIDPAELRLAPMLADLLFPGSREAEQPIRALTVAVPESVAERGGVVAVHRPQGELRFRVPAQSRDGSRLRLADGSEVVLRVRRRS